jgi:hypothetical protein
MNEPQDAKETSVQDFLKTFRIALNFISLYSKDHKSFVSALNDLYAKVGAFLSSSPQVNIIFSPESISVDGITYANKELYRDLARKFHFRKVKSLQISQGVTLRELSLVLETIVLPLKDILKRGGMQQILIKGEAANIVVEELDYSLLLGNTGEDSPDVWAYMLHETMQAQEPSRIKEFAENFESAVGKFSVKDMAADKNLLDNIGKFLSYLNTSDKEAFGRCAQALLRMILKDKNVSAEGDLGPLSDFVNKLSIEDISNIVVDEASRNEEFNNGNLSLFLKALDPARHHDFHSALANTIVSRQKGSHMSPKAAQKLKDLFTVSSSPLVSGIYQRVMDSLSAITVSENRFAFDQDHFMLNYRYILLFVLGIEQDQERLAQVAAKICAEWDSIVKDQRADYFQHLSAAISLHKDRFGAVSSLAELGALYRKFVEGYIWQDSVPVWLEPHINALTQTSLDAGKYIRKIFDSGRVNRYILQLYMRFFPQEIGLFCDSLAQVSADIEFIGEVVDELRFVPDPRTGEILEKIYGFSNDIIKAEVLRTMQGWEELNESFLLPIITDENYFLRKEAFAVLIQNSRTRIKAIDLLFGVDDIWGRKNSIILENIGIAQELHAREAAGHLERLAKRPFFWNAAVRRRANMALEVLHD